MHLSTHFTLEEMTFSDTATRLGIDNTPPLDAVDRLEELCQTLLEPIRARYGAVRVTSGYRCPDLNRLIGSKDSSQHTRGEAADIQCGARPLAVCRWLADSGMPFHQVIHEFGRWTHVSIAPRGESPRHQLLTIDKHGTRTGLHEIRP